MSKYYVYEFCRGCTFLKKCASQYNKPTYLKLGQKCSETKSLLLDKPCMHPWIVASLFFSRKEQSPQRQKRFEGAKEAF